MEKSLIANELLPVYQTTDTGEQVIDGRELHGYLDVGTRFNDWIARQIQRYGFTQPQDYYSFLSKTPEAGRPTTEYILKLDMAKELAMVENNDQGRKARRYFIEVEKRFRQGDTLKVPVVNLEHDKITKLLQILRMAERERLFSPKLDRAFREEVAAAVLGKSADTSAALPGPENFISKEASIYEKWYLTSQIANEAGVSTQMVAVVAKKNGLKSDRYSRVARSDPGKMSGLVQVFYNEEARLKLLALLEGRKSRSRKRVQR